MKFKYPDPIEVCILVVIILVTLVIIYPLEPSTSAFHTVAYKGHTYVVYDGGDFDSGVLHDPDCKGD